MFSHMTNLTKAIVFYAMALALSVTVVRMPDPLAYFMFTPIVAVALMLFVITRDGYSRAGWQSLGLHRLGLRGWGPALFIPLLALGFAYVVVWSTGLADLSIPATLGRRGTPISYFPLFFIVGVIQYTLSNSLGEELGWRGYLLPKLEHLGRFRALLISGVMHTVWHLPLIFLTTIYHSEGNRLITMPLFFVSVTLVGGIFMGYLRFITDSIWPAAIVHAAHNVAWYFLSGFTVGATPVVSEYLAGESGILTNLVYAVLVGWLIYRWSRQEGTARISGSIQPTTDAAR